MTSDDSSSIAARAAQEGVGRSAAAEIETLYRSCMPALRRYLVADLGPDAPVDDLLQEAFVIACAQWGRFGRRARPSTWVHGIALDTPQGRAALEDICRRYYPPVVQYLRHRGLDNAAVDDLAQDFFADLLESPELKRQSDINVSFGAYLLGRVEHRVVDHFRAEKAQKRGGGAKHHSLDAEPGLAGDVLVEHTSAAELFDRLCIRHHTELVVRELEEEYRAKGKFKKFDALRDLLDGEGDVDAASRVLRMDRKAVQAAARRLRDQVKERLVVYAGNGAVQEEAEAEARRWVAVLVG